MQQPMQPTRPSIDFDGLLLRVCDGRVAAIVGPELYRDADGRSVVDDIAGKLVGNLPRPPGSAPPALQDASPRRIALEYLRGGGTVDDLRSLLRRLHDAPRPTPPSLRQLATIRDITLYVTTMPDGALEKALAAVGRRPRVVSYAPKRRPLEMPPLANVEEPVVCHLFGSTATDEFAMTDADVVEYLHALSSNPGRPTRLFDHLRELNLMFVGCSFPGWLLRFFIRVTKDSEFRKDEDHKRVIADAAAAGDAELVTFLHYYNHTLWSSPPGTAPEFVAELYRRWIERKRLEVEPSPDDEPDPPPRGGGAAGGPLARGGHGAEAPSPKSPPDAGASGAAFVVEGELRSRVPDHCVFLSFSSLDRPRIADIYAKLKTEGLPSVFFDEDAIPPGKRWDQFIRESMIRAALVLPFVSRNTEAEGRQRYFWREWRFAAERALHEPPAQTYLIPVCLDPGIDPQQAQVFEEFREINWFPHHTRGTDALVAMVKEEYRRKQLARRQRR